MISIKKNIWTLFYAILFIGTILFFALSLKQWNDTYKDYKIKNENYTKIVANTLETHIDKIDLILTIVGKQLLENNRYKDREQAELILRQKNATPLKDYIFALVGPDGYVKATSREEIIENTPNLLDTEGARETFLQTLKSQEMVIGRTYALAATGKYTIPIRKTFRHDNGDPAGVLSVAIALDKFNLFSEKLLHSPSHIIHILRDSDRYRTFYSQYKYYKKTNL